MTILFVTYSQEVEISKELSEENTIPWCDKVEKISLNKANGKQVMQSRKV